MSNLPAVVQRLATDDGSADESRARLLLRLASGLGTSARTAGARAVATGRWLADVVEDLAPHVPVRDLGTLRQHYPGLAGDQLADALIDTASRTTAGIGAAMGMLATAEWSLPPALLSTPVQIAAETVAVVAVELKLVAELHEVYGSPVKGTTSERASAYLGAWARRRGIDPLGGNLVVTDVVSAAAKKQIRSRLMKRTGSSATSVLPFFAGAVAGGGFNLRATKRLGELVSADLVRSRRR